MYSLQLAEKTHGSIVVSPSPYSHSYANLFLYTVLGPTWTTILQRSTVVVPLGTPDNFVSSTHSLCQSVIDAQGDRSGNDDAKDACPRPQSRTQSANRH